MESFTPFEVGYEDPISLRNQVLSPPTPSEPHPHDKGGGRKAKEDTATGYDDDNEPQYMDIEDKQCDYVNVDDLDSDEDDENSADEAMSPHLNRGPKYAPSVKLHSHPLLRKTQSQSECDSPASMNELLKAASKKPKNRAPPPPPTDRKLGVASRHKRSRSDVNSDSSKSQRSLGVGERSPVLNHKSQRSPVAERKVSALNNKSRGQGSSSQPSPKFSQHDKPGLHGSSNIATRTPPTGVVSGSDGHRPMKSKSPTPLRPPPPPGPAPPGPRDRGVSKGAPQQILTRHTNASGEEKGVSRVAPPRPTTHERPHETEQKSRDQDQSPSSASTTPVTKPKRHAPPPPMGGALRKTPTSSPEAPRKKETPPPEYSEVMKVAKAKHGPTKNLDDEGASGHRSGPPPRPIQLSQTPSLEALAESQVYTFTRS